MALFTASHGTYDWIRLIILFYFIFVHFFTSQSLGVLLTVAGFVVIFLVGSYTSPNFPHAVVGIVLTFLLIQQFLSGI